MNNLIGLGSFDSVLGTEAIELGCHVCCVDPTIPQSILFPVATDAQVGSVAVATVRVATKRVVRKPRILNCIRFEEDEPPVNMSPLANFKVPVTRQEAKTGDFESLFRQRPEMRNEKI